MSSSAIFDDAKATGHRAGLILRRGVSACGAWVFSVEDAGKTITVGPASTCDWQIASPGVSPLFVSFTGDALLVRPVAPDVRVRLNGQTLPAQSWAQLCHGDELALGASSLAVHLAPALRGTKTKSRRRKRHRKESRSANGGTESTAGGLQLVLRDAFPFNVPSLFQDRDIRGRTDPRVLYAVIGFGTLITYMVWLALLDQF